MANQATTQVKVNPAKATFDVKGLQASAAVGMAVKGTSGARADLGMRLTHGADFAEFIGSNDFAISAPQCKLIPVCYLHLVEKSGNEVVTMGDLTNVVIPYVVKVSGAPVKGKTELDTELGKRLWSAPSGAGYLQDIATVWASTYGAALLGKVAGYGSKKGQDGVKVAAKNWTKYYEVFRIVS